MKIPNTVRWFLVLPTTIFFVFISQIILHTLLFQALTSIIKPYPLFFENLLLPLIISFIMVYIPFRVSPKIHQQYIYVVYAAITLLIGYTYCVIGLSGGSFFGHKLSLYFKGFELILIVIGVFFGVYKSMVWHASNDLPIE